MGISATKIVAYAYNADLYTPQGVIAALTTNPGQVGPVIVAADDVEAHLDVLARIAGIDRAEADSNEFPVPVFAYEMALDSTVVDTDGRHIRYVDTL